MIPSAGTAPVPGQEDPWGRIHDLELQSRALELENAQLRLELGAIRERFREGFDGAPAGHCTLGAGGLIRDANRTGAVLLGLPEDDLIGVAFSGLVALEDFEAYHQWLKGLLESHGAPCLEVRLRRADGSVFRALLQATSAGAVGGGTECRLMFSDISNVQKVESAASGIAIAVNQSPVSIVITDITGAIEYVNPKFTEMTGYSLAEALGQNPRILKWEGTPPEHYQELWATILAGGIWRGEFRNRKKNGEFFWERAIIAPVKSDWGHITHFVAIKEDITEHKRAKAALQESEKRFQTVVASLSEGIIQSDDQGSILAWNPAAEHILGLTGDQLKGLSVIDPSWDVVREDGSPLPAEDLPSRVALRTGDPQYGVIMGIHKPDGTRTWLSANAVPIVEPSGAPSKMVVVSFADITERKKSEITLRRSEEEFRSLAESMPQIVWATRPDGWITYINKQWMEYTGLTMEESRGHGWLAPFHPEDRQKAGDAWQEAMSNGGTYSLECRLRRADGDYRWWLIRGVPLLDQAGEVQKWFGTCTDIHDMRRAQEALRDSEARFVSMAEHSPVATYRYSSRTGGVYYSPRILQMLGYSQGELLAEPMLWHNSIHPDDLPAVDASIQAALRQSAGIDLAYRIRHKNGQEKWFRDTATSRLEPGGEVVIDGVAIDITERIHAGIVLRESNELLSHFIAQSPIYAYIKDVSQGQSRVVHASDNFDQLIGICGRDMVGKTMEELFQPEVAAKMTGDDYAVVASGKGMELEEVLNGRSYYTLKFPILQREKTLLAGFTIDITDREQAKRVAETSYQQLRLLLSRLQRAQEDERVRVSREVHDELGQQLTGLKLDLGWLERRLSETDLPSGLLPLLDKVMGTSELVDETIRTVQRIAAELRPNALEALGLEAALKQEARRFQQRSGVTCTLANSAAWPVFSANTAVGLFYICREALTNVARHARAKEVEISLHLAGEVALLEVADDGQGMAQEPPDSLGVVGMRERASQFGGSISFGANAPSGTRVIVSIPMPSAMGLGGGVR